MGLEHPNFLIWPPLGVRKKNPHIKTSSPFVQHFDVATLKKKYLFQRGQGHLAHQGWRSKIYLSNLLLLGTVELVQFTIAELLTPSTCKILKNANSIIVATLNFLTQLPVCSNTTAEISCITVDTALNWEKII